MWSADGKSDVLGETLMALMSMRLQPFRLDGLKGS
jgi:hypothetical protein